MSATVTTVWPISSQLAYGHAWWNVSINKINKVNWLLKRINSPTQLVILKTHWELYKSQSLYFRFTELSLTKIFLYFCRKTVEIWEFGNFFSVCPGYFEQTHGFINLSSCTFLYYFSLSEYMFGFLFLLLFSLRFGESLTLGMA